MPRPRGRLSASRRGRGRADAGATASRSRLSRRTSIAKTSSKVGRSSRALTTSLPAAPSASTMAGPAVPASSTTTLAWRGPTWWTSRTNERRRARAVEWCLGLDIDDVAADRLRRRSSGAPNAISRPSAMSATESHYSASLTYWVVTRSVRPASRSRCSSSQMRSAGADRARPSARRGTAGPVHGRGRRPARGGAASRRTASPRGGSDVPQVDQLEDFAHPPPARGKSRPNSGAMKSTFSRAVRSGYSVNDWGM